MMTIAYTRQSKAISDLSNRGIEIAISVAAAVAATVAALPAAVADAPKPGSVVLEAATAKTPDGKTVAYERGTLYVPENRGVPGSRIIAVPFARMKAIRPTSAPPIVHLPGGPGSSYLHAFSGARGEWSHHRLDIYLRYREIADVITIDQRGHSKLAAANVALPLPLDRPLTAQALAQAWTAYARALPAANPGTDLSGYNVTECAADVEDLRKALGYPKLTLIGESFGSQWSFAFMRLYPSSVARALLSGVEPLDAGFDMPSYVFAAMQRIAIDADKAEKLQPYLPKGGLMAAVRELRDRFAKTPVTVRVTDATSSKIESVVLGLEDLQAALAPGNYKEWPAFILSLYHGHYDSWARDAIAERRNTTFLQQTNPLIDSGLSVTPERRQLLYTDPAVEFLGTWGFTPHVGSRAAWPTPDLGDTLRTPIASPIPVVFLNGDWDTSTPLENMLGIAPYFTNSRSIIVHRGVHDVGYDTGEPAWRPTQRPEIFAAMLEFLRTGATATLPAEFTLPVPEFAAPAFPPPRR